MEQAGTIEVKPGMLLAIAEHAAAEQGLNASFHSTEVFFAGRKPAG